MREVDYVQYRIGNIELRPNHRKDSLEIVAWGNEKSCWVIASFVQNEETGKYSAHFVDDRAIDPNVNWSHLRHLIRFGYEYFAIGQEVRDGN